VVVGENFFEGGEFCRSADKGEEQVEIGGLVMGTEAVEGFEFKREGLGVTEVAGGASKADQVVWGGRFIEGARFKGEIFRGQEV
jgi:hypothetical protein